MTFEQRHFARVGLQEFQCAECLVEQCEMTKQGTAHSNGHLQDGASLTRMKRLRSQKTQYLNGTDEDRETRGVECHAQLGRCVR